MISANNVAQYLLYWANCNGELITNLKLQKLLYYAQAWYLVNYRKPLFPDPIEAWDFGPVIKEIYEKYKKFGARAIEYKDKNGKEAELFSRNQLNYLNEFCQNYVQYPAYMLVNASHNDAPWKDAHNSGNNAVISIDSMKKYYSEQLKNKEKKK